MGSLSFVSAIVNIVSPSISSALMIPVILSSSTPVLDMSPDMTAKSSTGKISSSTVCLVVPPRSSVTVTVNESVP